MDFGKRKAGRLPLAITVKVLLSLLPTLHLYRTELWKRHYRMQKRIALTNTLGKLFLLALQITTTLKQAGAKAGEAEQKQ